MEKANIRTRLLEVEVLRPLAVLLVVLLHSFTVYWGKWPAPEGYVHIAPYKWIAATSFSFTMELFVMLSGYVFGFQLMCLKRDFTLKSLLQNKFKRLLVPSLVFSVIYALIFYWYKDFFSALYSIINGAGHMWFLLMLFWCFAFGFILYKSKLQERKKFVLLLVCILLSTINFPFRLEKTLYYLFFFYLGITLIRRQDICDRISRNSGFMLVLAIIYLTFFIAYELVFPSLVKPENGFILETLLNWLKRFWMLTYSLAGTLLVFSIAYRIFRNKTSVSQKVIYCSSISFGVYLFHQIIIEVILYKTSLPAMVGPYLLPWLTFAIALSGSILLVQLLRKLNIRL
jgi:peptidoglycan/LPS O-acetylase OafA/YrhL